MWISRRESLPILGAAIRGRGPIPLSGMPALREPPCPLMLFRALARRSKPTARRGPRLGHRAALFTCTPENDFA